MLLCCYSFEIEEYFFMESLFGAFSETFFPMLFGDDARYFSLYSVTHISPLGRYMVRILSLYSCIDMECMIHIRKDKKSVAELLYLILSYVKHIYIIKMLNSIKIFYMSFSDIWYNNFVVKSFSFECIFERCRCAMNIPVNNTND